MTKRGIVEELLARDRGFSHRESETIVNAMFDAMANSLARGDRIEIRGFGSFGVKQRRARQGRNTRRKRLTDSGNNSAMALVSRRVNDSGVATWRRGAIMMWPLLYG